MTPKEKARQLIERFNHIDEYYYDESFKNTDLGKQCALIAVDEILNQDKDVFDWEEAAYHFEYWMNVKQEIEKL